MILQEKKQTNIIQLVASNWNRKAIIKSCASFTDCRSETNNTQIDNAKGIDVITPMYNLIECSNNYSKTSGRLWQYYRGEPAINDDGNVADFFW